MAVFNVDENGLVHYTIPPLQLTDLGSGLWYSFLTPAGQYRMEAWAPGYQPYDSPILTVITDPVLLDIGLPPIMDIFIPVMVRLYAD